MRRISTAFSKIKISQIFVDQLLYILAGFVPDGSVMAAKKALQFDIVGRCSVSKARTAVRSGCSSH
jgi:hypothetical protein